MKKTLVYILLISFLASCSGYRSRPQPWQPKQHGGMSNTKKPKSYRR